MPQFEREVEINAPVQKVWEALINPNTWSEWFPGIESVAGATSVSEGGTFEWMSAGKQGTGVIVKMDPLKRLVVRTQMGDDKDEHIFALQPSGGFFGLNADETKVQYTLDTLMGGGILGSFLAGGNPKDALRVKNATNLLRKLVEGS